MRTTSRAMLYLIPSVVIDTAPLFSLSGIECTELGIVWLTQQGKQWRQMECSKNE